MAGTMRRSPSVSSVSGEADVLVGEVEGPGDFGSMTISLSDDGLASVEALGGERRSVSWLLRFAQVLELKLAAMK
jgi:hypothetical protein